MSPISFVNESNQRFCLAGNERKLCFGGLLDEWLWLVISTAVLIFGRRIAYIFVSMGI